MKGRRGGSGGDGDRRHGRSRAAGIVAGAVLAIAACGHEDGQAPVAGPDAGHRATAPEAVPARDDARTLLDRVRATFPAAARELQGGGAHAVAGSTRPARLELAVSSQEATRVTDAASGATIAFRLHTARNVRASLAGDVRVLGDALPGAHAFQVTRAEGVEDLVAFETRPAVEALVYDVDVSQVAGLRLVGGQLEMLDAGGAPRLRVAPPYVVDAGGVRRDAELDVAGCAVDRDAREPWGRAVVPPGAPSCEVRVRWSSATYPLLVDPSWTTTGALAQKRRRLAAVTLSTGRVLAMGGTLQPSNDGSAPLATSELYDPASGTWAAGAPMPVARVGHTATALKDGRVVVVGGEVVTATDQSATDTTVFYAPATAKWSAGPTMAFAMTDHKAALLPNGKVLALVTNSPQELDPAGAGSWSATPKLPISNAEYAIVVSPPAIGKVLVCGGYLFGTLGYIYQTSYAIYDVAARTWTKGTGAMKAARARHAAVLLPGGSALVTGGVNGGTAPENSAEIYDWSADTWSTAGTMAGGATASTELFVPATGAWSPGGDMGQARANFPLVALPSGQALAVAGDAGGEALASTELFGVATGKACASDGQCLSSRCADGVCCGGACDGGCVACSAAAKGGGSDGTCEPILRGRDPRATCAAAKPETCGASGLGCDGAGQCLRYGAETECRPATCTAGAETRSACDGAGSCQAHGTGCGAYVCAGDACKATCDADADCASGNTCDLGAHACVSATRCASDHEQQNPDGSTTDCGAYRCLGVACVARCGSVDECLAGYVCDKDAHCVVPPTSAAGDAGGCAIAPGRARRGPPAWSCVAAAGLLALAVARGRRRAR
jgi:hypothetical protein